MLANLVGDWYWPVLAIIILFGGSQLPKLARNAGLAMKEFRSAHNEATSSPLAGNGMVANTQMATGAAVPMVGAPMATPLTAGAPVAPAAAVPVNPANDEKVTLTRAELDALLANREAQARAANNPSQPA